MRVNLLTLVGAALIVLGFVAFTYRGIPYRSTATATDAASLRTRSDSRKVVPMSPLVVGLVFVGGAVLLAAGSARSS